MDQAEEQGIKAEVVVKHLKAHERAETQAMEQGGIENEKIRRFSRLVFQ